MEDPVVPFSELEEAVAYMRDHKGRIIRFDDITMDMLSPTKHDSPKHSPLQHDHSS